MQLLVRRDLDGEATEDGATDIGYFDGAAKARPFAYALIVRSAYVIALAIGLAGSIEARGAIRRLAPKTGEPACTILEHGPYVPVSARRHYADPRAASGRSFEIDEVELTKPATAIEMKLGTGFGIRYRARLPADATVTARIIYPKPLRGVPEWRNDIELARGEHVRHFVHDFEYAWELVPGRWRFQVLVDGTPVCGLTFVVK